MSRQVRTRAMLARTSQRVRGNSSIPALANPSRRVRNWPSIPPPKYRPIARRDAENEAKVFAALATLPDNAVRELQPGELKKYNVIRVGDEILVDLKRSAGGIDYAAAAPEVVVRELGGVPIPFASPRLLWRMKAVTHRAKDAQDLIFLRAWFAEHGE